MVLPFSIVVAMDAERGIGKDGVLPWKLSADLKHFRDMTTATKDPAKQNAVLMGRKTWDSLPEKFKPLPGRYNIVLTRNKNFSAPEGVKVIHAWDEAEAACQQKGDIENLFVIGGAEIFKLALNSPHCTAIYLTRIQQSFPCDTVFPPFENQFEVSEEGPLQTEDGKAFSFAYYRRRD